jgi:lysophospholipase L1-like esterase
MDLKQEGILKDSRILEKDLGRAKQGRLKYEYSLPSSQMIRTIFRDYFMKRVPLRAMIVTMAVAAFGATSWIVVAQQPSAFIPDPQRFEKNILAFEKLESRTAPPTGSLLFTGSSTIRDWSHLDTDFQGLSAVGRGFGGSRLTDVIYYLDRLVAKPSPRGIVIYEGDNDLHEGVSIEELMGHYDQFYSKLRTRLPECRLYVLSIKPSPSRWREWPVSSEANLRLKSWCASKKATIFIDVATPMLDKNGQPRKELFSYDRLHMNRKGYEVWIDVMKPLILKAEGNS